MAENCSAKEKRIGWDVLSRKNGRSCLTFQFRELFVIKLSLLTEHRTKRRPIRRRNEQFLCNSVKVGCGTVFNLRVYARMQINTMLITFD